MKIKMILTGSILLSLLSINSVNENNVKYIYYVDSWEANYDSGNTLGSHQDLTINALNSVQTTESSRYIIHS